MSTTLAAAVVATTVRLVASHAYAEGAPPGFSGGFKEDSCHACHFHAEPNSGAGTRHDRGRSRDVRARTNATR